MTHPLSEEMRKLAYEPQGQDLAGMLHRAADALDEADTEASEERKLSDEMEQDRQHFRGEIKALENERDELRDLLTIIKSEYGGVVEDMATKDFADKVKTVGELRQQLYLAQRDIDLLIRNDRAERAEAQAARYKAALEKIRTKVWHDVPGPLATIAIEALREPETGGDLRGEGIYSIAPTWKNEEEPE